MWNITFSPQVVSQKVAFRCTADQWLSCRMRLPPALSSAWWLFIASLPKPSIFSDSLQCYSPNIVFSSNATCKTSTHVSTIHFFFNTALNKYIFRSYLMPRIEWMVKKIPSHLQVTLKCFHYWFEKILNAKEMS